MNMNAIDALLILTGSIGAVAGLSFWLRNKRPLQARPAVPPIYTNHAKERMLERQVRQHQIEQVIAKPSRSVADRENASVLLEGEVDGRILRVWVVAEQWEIAKSAIVKTTAWADLVQTFDIQPARAGLVIGLGGSTVRGIEAATNTRISVGRTGMVRVSATSMASIESAKQRIAQVVKDADGASGSGRRAA